MLKIGHPVTRPGKRPGDPPVTIPVPEEFTKLVRYSLRDQWPIGLGP